MPLVNAGKLQQQLAGVTRPKSCEDSQMKWVLLQIVEYCLILYFDVCLLYAKFRYLFVLSCVKFYIDLIRLYAVMNGKIIFLISDIVFVF